DVNVKKLSDEEREKLGKELRKTFDSDIADTEAYIEDAMQRMRDVWELFQAMGPKQVVNDETTFRELKDRFGSPYGFGEYFRGGMGAESVRDLGELFKAMGPRQVFNDETPFREPKDGFGSPYGFGEYFRGGRGAESVRDLLSRSTSTPGARSSRTRSSPPRARSRPARSSA